jgi:hypothetical protein
MRLHAKHVSPRCALAWLALVVALLLLLAACASTRVESQWRHPEASSYRLSGRVLVVGVTRDATARRLYEDAMAAELAARGVTAVRSYDVMAGDLPNDNGAALTAAAQRSSAAAILSSALVAHEQIERVILDPTPQWRASYVGWYGHYWDLVRRVEVRTYERYVASTSLTEVTTGCIMWTARTLTESPGAMEHEVKVFAQVIAKALAEAALL